jgi:asparagine synthase (glutamine-hydrolysing)
MAGLAFRPIEPTGIKTMCDILAHRGPDDAGYAYFRKQGTAPDQPGYWSQFADPAFAAANENLPVWGGRYFDDELGKIDFEVAFGHRRLSVLDLTHYGHQPMASWDHRYWCTYNGEIYNCGELRETLAACGYVFRTRTDTEVLLNWWMHREAAGLPALDGMFAFAIYDTVRHELVLVRDRFGVKPLYYAVRDGVFYFASEPKGILAAIGEPAQLNSRALAQYFTFQNILDDQTVFEGVRLLPAGAILRLPLAGTAVPEPSRFHRGWNDPVDLTLVDAEVAAGTVGDRFVEGVQRQLLSDTPVGSFLSGGMDSGSIVAAAGQRIPRLLTFTAGFDLTNVNGIEQGFDERDRAEQLAYLLQSEHYEVVLHAGDMPAAMESLSWHVDDPRVGMCHQNWYASKLASRFVKVCLAGAGGDELFGGYPWRYEHSLADGTEFGDAYFRYWVRLLEPGRLAELFDAGVRDQLEEARDLFAEVLAQCPDASRDLGPTDNRLQRCLHFEWRTFLQGILLVEDRVSMAHGMETRVPFLDNRLADLAWRLPPGLKVASAGADTEYRGKRVLRLAAKRLLPDAFLEQRKQGFSPPDENWYRGPSMDYIREILLDDRTRSRTWLDTKVMEPILDEHFSGQQNHRLLIWSLLTIEWLQRHYVDRVAQPQAPR